MLAYAILLNGKRLLSRKGSIVLSRYEDELKEIRRKTRRVFNRHGIYPFLDDGIQGDGSTGPGDIPGFQIFQLWPDIDIKD